MSSWLKERGRISLRLCSFCVFSMAVYEKKRSHFSIWKFNDDPNLIGYTSRVKRGRLGRCIKSNNRTNVNPQPLLIYSLLILL